ncbi:hypothetical protein Tco_1222130 [Tanacetum coccineum]
MCTYLKNMEGYKLQDLKKESRSRAGTREYKEAKVKDDKETSELKELMEITSYEEEVTIVAVPLAIKSPYSYAGEKKFPLAPLTLSKMLEKKLIIDYKSEMAYHLLKFIMK